eukprot:scaffold3.g6759.t1
MADEIHEFREEAVFGYPQTVLSPAFWRQSISTLASRTASLTADEAELVEAVKALRREHEAQKVKKMSSKAKQELVAELFGKSEDVPIAAKLNQLFRALENDERWLPELTIEYRDLTVEADALVGAASVPSVLNSAKLALKKLTLQGGLSTKRVTVLDGINGVLRPSSLTLLLGPPGAGKSVLLQALAGRLQPSHRLRISGSVKYNGVEIRDIVARRTAGLVDQYDYHIPELSVLETVSFAADCMIKPARLKAFVEAMREASARLEAEKAAHDAAAARAHAVEAGGAAGGGKHEGEGKEGSDDELQHTSSGPLKIEQFDVEFARLLSQGAPHGLRPYVTLQLLGLQDVAHTNVGDAMKRGVSGGQRKRVTCAEIIAGPQVAVLMDEISTGLDSATTYSVIHSFRASAHALRKTFLISLLQPPPEVLYLFDDLLLLTDGRVLFHGPVTEVLGHFAGLGYACPVRKDPGSFLQEVSTPAGQLAYATPAQLAAKGLTEADRAPAVLLERPPTALLTSMEELSQAFWTRSKWGQEMRAQLDDAPFDPARGSPHALARDRFASGWGRLMGLVLERGQIRLNIRMKPFHIARTIQTIVMSLITASLFATITPSPSEGRNVLSYSMLNVAFVATMAMPQIAMVFATKRVFYKARAPAGGIPMSLTEAISYTLVAYWVVGLTRTASGYFTYFLIYFSTSNCMSAIYRLIAFGVPNMTVANATGAMALLLFIITNGFTIVRTSMPPYLIWVYWINPMAWALRAFSINELTTPRWVPYGTQTLNAFGMGTSRGSVWAGVGFLWAALVVVSVAGAAALRFTNPPKPQPSVTEEQQKAEVTRGVMAGLRLRLALAGKMRRARSRALAVAPAPSRPPSSAPSAAGSADRTASAALAPASADEASADHHSTSATNGSAADSGHAGAEQVAVPFTPITLVINDLRYYVDDPSGGWSRAGQPGGDSLGISFFAEPGELVALMGGSGAGKTTLMARGGGARAGTEALGGCGADCVLGRKTQGLIRGDILVNGHPKKQETWSRVAGYDIHTSKATVRESLMFSARLRLDASVNRVVDQTLELVELGPLAGLVVGEPGGDGLSIEQRKRLSIAVELVANPSVMFLPLPGLVPAHARGHPPAQDEPTSGLDARAAAIVMRAVKNVALSNRTVMVTIHQPSIEIFENFTMLVLLQRGGRLTYFGPLGFESADLIAYLEAQPGVHPISQGYNPATWCASGGMLEVTGGSMSTSFASSGADFPALYAASELAAANAAKAARLAEEGRAAHEPLALATRYAAPPSMQRAVLMHKWLRVYWRSPDYNWVRLSMTVVIALIYGLMYLNEGKLDPAGVGIQAVQNISGLIFSMTIFLGMFNCMTVMPVIAAERMVYYREKASSMYAPGPFSLASGLVEIPYLLVQSGLMIGITYCWKWMNRISPTTWILEGLACSQLCDQEIPMQAGGAGGQSRGRLPGRAARARARASSSAPSSRLLTPFVRAPHPTPSGLPTPPPSQDFSGQTTTVSAFVSDYFTWEFSMIWWCTLIVFAFMASSISPWGRGWFWVLGAQRCGMAAGKPLARPRRRAQITFRVLATLAVSYINFQKR